MAEQEIIALGIVAIKNTGEYDAETNYEKLNVVTYQGSSYCALRDTVGNLPTNTDYWQLYAQKGDKGDTGDTGETGDTGPRGPKGDPGGKPLVASSTSEMTDTTSVYVNTSDGHWYSYNGTQWVDCGVYQSTAQIYDNTLTINNATPNSKIVGDKINNSVYTENLFDKNNYTNNTYISSSGVKTSSTNYFITDIIEMKKGETIYPQLWTNYNNTNAKSYIIFRVSKVNADGSWISNITPVPSQFWKADEDCFIILTFEKQSVFTDTDYENDFTLTKQTPLNSYKPYNYKLNINYKELDEISYYQNIFDGNDLSYGSSINTQGYLTSAPNFFTTGIFDCKIGDAFYLKYFNNNDQIQFTNVALYDENMNFISRSSVNAKTYISSVNGYVKFTCANPSLRTDIADYLVISKNQEVSSYIPHQRSIVTPEIDNNNNVSIEKIDDNNYLISFGDFKITLFKTDNNYTNSHNWNLKEITDKIGNVIVPTGTDIIGPIKVNNNTDFIGGVHGDETTDYITISINNASYDIEDITQLNGKSLNLIMKSSVYDELTKNKVADRFVTIRFDTNKINISNSYKFVTSTTLKVATNGGLIACRNNIIKDLIFNNHYYSEAPTTSQGIASRYNTSATINTIYGSVTVNNIKGYLSTNYSGYLHVFTNETPMRCKIYFMTYSQGNYSMNNGDIVTGEFEYLFS